MKKLASRVPRAALAAGILASLLAAPPARAWDPETHTSIVRLALAISPEADARIRSNYEGFYAAVAAPDPFDKKCTVHPTLEGSRDAASTAAVALEQLLGGKMIASADARAHAIGRLLHYVADAAMPEAALRATTSDVYDPYWAGNTFAVFRESRPLSRPFADSIRAIGADARWGTDSPSTRSYAYRLAVNLAVDTLLALPAVGEVKAGPAPAIFCIDRRPKAPPPSARTQSLAARVKAIKERAASAKSTPPPDAADTDTTTPPTDRPGLHLVEWVTRPAASGTEVRALLYNNDERCAEQVAITGGPSAIGVPGRVAPRALRSIALAVPASTAGMLRAAGREVACAPPYGAEAGTPAPSRVLLSSAGRPPDIEKPLAEAPPQ